MNRFWNFISSTYLSVVLIAIICAITIWGSFLAVKYRWFYEVVDKAILFPWLAEKGREYIVLTHWIYALIILSALFAMNTTACTLDKLYAIYKHKRPWQSLLPQLVHVGFLIAMLGHLVGSTYGFRAHDVFIREGVVMPVEGTSYAVRLDSSHMEISRSGMPSRMDAAITVFKEGVERKKGVMSINSPVIADGRAFYVNDAGEMPVGLYLSSGGVRTEAPFNGSFSFDGKRTFSLARVFPDFAVNSAGEPYSVSNELRNPHVEIIGAGGRRAYLPLSRPGSAAEVSGVKITFENFKTGGYASVNVVHDPGIAFIIAGSAILSLGMLALFFYRGERGELMGKSS